MSDKPEGNFEQSVADVIAVIRPAIQADDGDIFLRRVDEESGVVTVELTGACVTCPVSSSTLKDGIQRILLQRVDGVTEVVHEGASLVEQELGTSVSF